MRPFITKALPAIPVILFLVALVLMGKLMGQQLSPEDILQKTDDVANAPKNQYMESTMLLIDKDGDQKERKMLIYQKGEDNRLVRFLSPADQKGISFLSLPNDVMYLYLPAFRKIRMIASHVKNESFAGTDFSYDDMSSYKFADEYTAVLTNSDDQYFNLELKPKPNVDKDYSKLEMTILKDKYIAVKINYFDKGGNLWKTLTRGNLVKKDDYWVAMTMMMKDLKKKHNTVMNIEKIDFDIEMSDTIFTKRYLKRIN